MSLTVCLEASTPKTGLVLRHCLQVQIARTGDIIALGGLKDVITGETLCDEKAPIMLERMEFPDPVIKVHHRTSATTHAVSTHYNFCLDLSVWHSGLFRVIYHMTWREVPV